MEKFEDLLPVDAQLAQMMLGDVQVASDRISLLRGKYEKLVSAMANGASLSAEERLPPATPVIEIPALDQVTNSNEADHARAQPVRPRVVPLSAKLDRSAKVTDILREAGWVANDPFEFEPAYQIA